MPTSILLSNIAKLCKLIFLHIETHLIFIKERIFHIDRAPFIFPLSLNFSIVRTFRKFSESEKKQNHEMCPIYGGILKYKLMILVVLCFSKTSAQEWTQSDDEQGLVVIAAEDYSAYRAGSGEKEGETFILEDSNVGFIGDGYMRANMTSGDGSIENAESINIKLSYNIEFTKTGTHYIWAHVFFPSPTEDSFFFGINGKVIDQIAGSPRGVWNWHKGNASNGDPFNYYNFTDDAKQVYLNEIARMVNLPQVPQIQEDLSQIFVAPNGDDNNPGTIDEPLASLQKAQQLANAGDTVYIRGGTYQPAEADISQVVSGLFASITYLHKSGTQGNTIKYWAYPGETPVFDFSNVKPAGRRVVGIYVEGSYLHLKGIEMTGIQTTITSHTESYCIYSRGSNNIYEEIVMHDNVGTGLRHYAGGGNLFLNCDAYNNWDNVSEDRTGSNNDGFGCHPSEGVAVNVFKGCRAWFNSDDGFDIIRADESVVFDSCWAFYNGYSSAFQSLGDGNGFKAGGFAYDQEASLPEIIPRHTIRFCIAVRNKANGFYANHHLGGNDWLNNSAYNNGVYDFNMLNRPSRADANNIDGPGYEHVLKNNMAFAQFGNGTANISSDLNTQQTNTWTLGINVNSDDFRSIEMNQLTDTRKEDGSLPDIDFLYPTTGSSIIDAGVDIGFPFNGDAPDLGALEFDQSTSVTSVESNIPEQMFLFPNYPNPFNQATTIRYVLAESGIVTLSIFNLLGQQVNTLVYGQNQNPGEYIVQWEGKRESGEKCVSGIYFYRLITSNAQGKRIQQKKMILLK